MNNSFIEEQLVKLQEEYYICLETMLCKYSTSDYLCTVDEINLFWYSNRKIVNMALKYLTYDYECHVFTGATFLDINDNEHIPFTTFGDMHIVDDPLHKFIMCNYQGNQELSKTLNEQIKFTIEDNMNIIKNYSGKIFVLPITLLTDIDSELISEGASQLFFSMFKDEGLDKVRYFEEIDTIEDVEKALKPEVIDNIIFEEHEDRSLSLQKRFRNFIKEGSPFGEQFSEAQTFFFLIMGFSLQSFNILSTCIQYNMIPYLRYEVTYHYAILLSGNFGDDKRVVKIINTMAYTHLFYKLFNKTEVEGIEYDTYHSALEDYEFENKVMDKVENIELHDKNAIKIVGIIKSELEEFYKYLKSKYKK